MILKSKTRFKQFSREIYQEHLSFSSKSGAPARRLLTSLLLLLGLGPVSYLIPTSSDWCRAASPTPTPPPSPPLFGPLHTHGRQINTAAVCVASVCGPARLAAPISYAQKPAQMVQQTFFYRLVGLCQYRDGQIFENCCPSNHKISISILFIKTMAKWEMNCLIHLGYICSLDLSNHKLQRFYRFRLLASSCMVVVLLLPSIDSSKSVARPPKTPPSILPGGGPPARSLTCIHYLRFIHSRIYIVMDGASASSRHVTVESCADFALDWSSPRLAV